MLNLCAKSAAYADISLILRPTFRAAICLPISIPAEATVCYHQIKKKENTLDGIRTHVSMLETIPIFCWTQADP